MRKMKQEQQQNGGGKNPGVASHQLSSWNQFIKFMDMYISGLGVKDLVWPLSVMLPGTWWVHSKQKLTMICVVI